jgi:hypothetical protein
MDFAGLRFGTSVGRALKLRFRDHHWLFTVMPVKTGIQKPGFRVEFILSAVAGPE